MHPCVCVVLVLCRLSRWASCRRWWSPSCSTTSRLCRCWMSFMTSSETGSFTAQQSSLFLYLFLFYLFFLNLFLFQLGWLKRRIGQSVNTHPSPNPSLTLEMSTIQTEATQARWLRLRHATLVGKATYCHTYWFQHNGCRGFCTVRTSRALFVAFALHSPTETSIASDLQTEPLMVLVFCFFLSVCALNVWLLKLVGHLLSQKSGSVRPTVHSTLISVGRLTRWPCPPPWHHQMFPCR